MRVHTLRRLVSVLGLLVSVFLASTLTIQAAPTKGSIQGAAPAFNLTGQVAMLASPAQFRAPGAHFFDIATIPLQLTDAHYYVIRGTLVDGMYQFPIQMQSDPGVRVGGIEMAVNNRAHTELIEVGIPTAASAAAVDQLNGRPMSAVQPYTSGSGDAPLHLIWHDPVNIWVVEVFDILHWNYNGTTTTITSNTSSTYDYEHWLSADGWMEDSRSVSDGYDLGGSRAWDDTSANFHNSIFCGNQPTLTTYIGVHENYSFGYANGTRGELIQTGVSGGCSNLLNNFWQWG